MKTSFSDVMAWGMIVLIGVIFILSSLVIINYVENTLNNQEAKPVNSKVIVKEPTALCCSEYKAGFDNGIYNDQKQCVRWIKCIIQFK